MKRFSRLEEPLHTLWDTALKNDPFSHLPFLTYAWHTHWSTCFGAEEQLTILADPEANVILPLSIRGGVVHFSGGEEVADYLDAIGIAEKKAEAWSTALPILKEQGATSMHLRNIPDGSPTLEYFRTLPQAEITKEDTTPILSLPATFDEYLGALDRKDRHELKRKMKKFEAEHQPLTFSVRQKSEIQTASLISLMRHDADKVAFLTPSMTTFFEGLPALFPDSARQFILAVGEKIIASTLAFQTSDALLLYNSGFDPQYPGAGWYIKVKSIAWAIDQHIAFYNFLQGNERYKYDLGAADTPVYQVNINLTLPAGR